MVQEEELESLLDWQLVTERVDPVDNKLEWSEGVVFWNTVSCTIDKMDRDTTCSQGNSNTSKYEVFLVFCSFLCISLNVLVSFLNFYRNFCKNSPTHANSHTEMWKIQEKLHI
jgi:hypothetical protein